MGENHVAARVRLFLKQMRHARVVHVPANRVILGAPGVLHLCCAQLGARPWVRR